MAAGPEYLVSGDFNGDGRLDLVTTSYHKGALTVLLQTTVSLSPGSLFFQPQLLATTSAPLAVTLTNNGASALTIGGLSITGVNSGSFSIASDLCGGATLPAGGHCTVGIVFTPGIQGPLSAFLTVADNGLASPQQVPLTGSGTVVELSATSLNFGSVQVGTASTPKVVIVTNTGAVSISTKIAVAGPDPGDFVTLQSCGQSLNAGASCTIMVFFTPTATGSRKANLQFQYSGASEPSIIYLQGSGT